MINNSFCTDLKQLIYLGPEGSYSNAAANMFSELYGLKPEFLPCSSISEVIRTLQRANNDKLAAVIPIENSVEGVVRESIDNLSALAALGIQILSELRLPVEHALIGFAKDKTEIKTISSHPQALAQCRNYIYNTWEGEIEENPVLSTSLAVRALSPDKPESAAIGSEYCANIYKIPVIDRFINDEKNNTTRFILLGKASTAKGTSSRTSITFSTENKPGALNKVLEVLERFSLNMSYIDSRPSRKQLGEYIFYIDFEGHITDENVNSALQEIKESTNMFTVLGSYDVSKMGVKTKQ